MSCHTWPCVSSLRGRFPRGIPEVYGCLRGLLVSPIGLLKKRLEAVYDVVLVPCDEMGTKIMVSIRMALTGHKPLPAGSNIWTRMEERVTQLRYYIGSFRKDASTPDSLEETHLQLVF